MVIELCDEKCDTPCIMLKKALEEFIKIDIISLDTLVENIMYTSWWEFHS